MSNISNRLSKLDKGKSILFCASICSRMFPSYYYFFTQEKWGNPGILVEFTDSLYDYSIGRSHNATAPEDIEEAFPDLDDFDSKSASYAFDACVAMHESVLFLDSLDSIHVINSSTTAFNTVDMFVQEYLDIDPNTPGLEQLISSHPFMIKEVEKQLSILEYLEKITSVKESDIEFIKMQCTNAIVDLSLLS